jgi:hypothetical protein
VRNIGPKTHLCGLANLLANGLPLVVLVLFDGSEKSLTLFPGSVK